MESDPTNQETMNSTTEDSLQSTEDQPEQHAPISRDESVQKKTAIQVEHVPASIDFYCHIGYSVSIFSTINVFYVIFCFKERIWIRWG